MQLQCALQHAAASSTPHPPLLDPSPIFRLAVHEDGTATVQADEADVQFFTGHIAKKWGLCLTDKHCPWGEVCEKHHCEV